jgi:hypothetical protein
MVTEAARPQFATDLRQLQHLSVAIEGLIRHLDHIAPADHDLEAQDLLDAAGYLATALERVIQDTEPGLGVRWIRGRPHPLPRHCRQCAESAGL